MQMADSINPPLEKSVKGLLRSDRKSEDISGSAAVVDFPLIDLARLHLGGRQREECQNEIVEESKEWGFFLVRNHRISKELLDRVYLEQMKLLVRQVSFEDKVKHSTGSTFKYAWGTQSAQTLQDFSWSEQFSIYWAKEYPLPNGALRSTIKEFSEAAYDLAQELASILARGAGDESSYFADNCPKSESVHRLNGYPTCSYPSKVFGFVPHTDSYFLTILNQDQVGGLQLLKDGRWITVKPIQDALIVNIGDMFQAWSNGAYKSVKYRVLANGVVDRYSAAFFMFPSLDAMIIKKPSKYRKFTYRDYRQQVDHYLKTTGTKI